MSEAVINIQRKRDAKNPLSRKVDDDTFFRYFYLPYVITDVFFDYVDAVLDQIAYLRDRTLKKLMHQIRWVRQGYEQIKLKSLGWDNCKDEESHMEYFITFFSKEFATEYDLIKWQVSAKRKMLGQDWRTLVASIYMALCVYKALEAYCAEADRMIAELWGRANRKIMLPHAMQIAELVHKCIGENDVLGEQELKLTCERMLGYIRQVGFTDKRPVAADGKDRVTSEEKDWVVSEEKAKTLYERYLEEKGDAAKAPAGTTAKLMKEFGIATEREYYKELKKQKSQKIKKQKK